MGGLSIWHWLIVLAIVVLIFGTKRLTGGAKDLGNAVKEFKKAVRDDSDAKPADAKSSDPKITDPIHEAFDPAKQPPVVAPGDDKSPRG